MNITSCSNCGVVLDKDQLGFHDDIYDGDGVVIESIAGWNGDRWVALVPCPVCKHDVLRYDE